MRPSFRAARTALAAALILAAGVACQGRPAAPSSSSGVSASASSSSNTAPTPSSSSAPPSLSTYTSTTTLSRGQALPTALTVSASRSGSVYFIPVVTTLPPPPPSSTATPTESGTAATASATPKASSKLPLKTKIDPAFGILGALLLLTGLPMTFYGHRNRWSSYFIAGYYSLGLVTICIILKAGVQDAINPPSQTVRGLFLLATIVAGAVGGILCIVFWRAASLLASGLGGFMLGLFLQAVRSGGLVHPLGLRYVLYIPLFAIFFALSCSEKIHSLVLALATAITGATAVTLAIDCFSTQGLKEFYIRNLGFDWLFESKYPPTFENSGFPLVQGMQIELGVLGALVIMGTAFQLRLWSDLRHSMAVLKKSDEERRMRSKAERAARAVARTAKRDLAEWERRHGYNKTSARPTVPDEEKDGRSLFSKDDGHERDRKGSLMSFMSGPAATTPGSFNGLSRAESPGASSVLKDGGSGYPFPAERQGPRRNSSFMSYLQRGPEKPILPGDAPPQLELAGVSSAAAATAPRTLESTMINHQSDAAVETTDDPQKLLNEISNIRRSIQMLRASSAGLDAPGPSGGSPSLSTSDRAGWSSPGQTGSKSLDLSRMPTSPAAVAPPAPQSFRERHKSTNAILSGSASFLSKSPAESPMVSQGAGTSSNGAGGSQAMTPSTSHTGDRSGTIGSGAAGPWLPSPPMMSRSASEMPSPIPALASTPLPPLPTDSVQRPTSPPVPCLPGQPASPAVYSRARSPMQMDFAPPPFEPDQMPASALPTRRMSSGDTLYRAEFSHERGDIGRSRNNSMTQRPHHSRTLTKSMDEMPSTAVVAAKRSIAKRRNDAPTTPWTNPGMHAAGPSYSSTAKPTADRPARRSMTIEELDARHRAKLAAMQKPVTDSVKEAEMVQSMREEYEKKQRAEKRRMMERERERQAALAALGGDGRAAATSPDGERQGSRRLSATLLQAVGEEAHTSGGMDRAAAWRSSISKVAQVDPEKGRTSQPSSQIASPPRSSAGAAAALSGQRGATTAASPTNPFPTQPAAKRRELSETDRRRLSQGAGGGDRRSRRMSQPLLDFQLPAPQ